jgi:hypothetical protein
VRFLRTRNESLKALLGMIHLVERQYGVREKVLQTDNAGELTSNTFEDELAKLGV